MYENSPDKILSTYSHNRVIDKTQTLILFGRNWYCENRKVVKLSFRAGVKVRTLNCPLFGRVHCAIGDKSLVPSAKDEVNLK